MTDELRPLTPLAAARRLDLAPDELVRLLVLADVVPDGELVLDDDALDAVREAGGLDSPWADTALPDDDDPRRARVRGVLRVLLERECVDGLTLRADNLWRGLDGAEALLVRSAGAAMVREGLLHSTASPRGVEVGIAPGRQADVERIAAGGTVPERVAAAWKGQS